MATTSASQEAGLGMPANPPKEDLYRADFTADLEVRDDTGDGPVLHGHFSKFNEWTEINSSYEGNFMERVAPGAFRKTIAESANKMRVLFNHGKDVLGQQILGPIRSLREDDIGAAYEVPLFDGIPPLILEGLRAGQYGSSFRFGVEHEDFQSKPARSAHNPRGIPERTILEARVREFGPVTFGAYAGATAGVRSITDEVIFNDLLNDPERLRALIAEEVEKHFKRSSERYAATSQKLYTVTAGADTTEFPSVTNIYLRTEPEPDPSGDTTPDEPSEPEPPEATTRTEPGTDEPEPSAATTPELRHFDTREEWLQWISKT